MRTIYYWVIVESMYLLTACFVSQGGSWTYGTLLHVYMVTCRSLGYDTSSDANEKKMFVWLVGFLTPLSATRLYRGRVPRLTSDNFTCTCCHTRDKAGRPWLLSQPATLYWHRPNRLRAGGLSGNRNHDLVTRPMACPLLLWATHAGAGGERG